MIPILRALKRRRGPQLLHVITQKGHGYSPAASDPVRYHATGTFNAQQGLQASAPGPQSFTQVFGNWLCDEAELPERYFDVGIAEQHALTFAAGLATEGLKPVVAIYSTFLQRAYDQLIHDIAIQNDIAYLRCIPNLVIMTPADENECRQLLHTGLLHDGPVAVRYSRGTGCGATVETHLSALPIGRGEIRRRSAQLPGHRVAILAFGPLLSVSLEAAQHLDATVANMRYAKPLDMDLIENLASSHDLLVTVEEGCVKGGAGAACLEHLAASLMGKPLLQLGLSDQFIEHATVEQLLHASGLDVEGIVTTLFRSVAAWRPQEGLFSLISGAGIQTCHQRGRSRRIGSWSKRSSISTTTPRSC